MFVGWTDQMHTKYSVVEIPYEATKTWILDIHYAGRIPQPKVVVSYADTAQDHLGIIYQATNFLFTGTTKARTDMAGKDGKHSRHHLGDKTKRIPRSSKHRYVYFIGNKKQKKILRNALRYEIHDNYPKF